MKDFALIIPLSLLVFLCGCETQQTQEMAINPFDLTPENLRSINEIELGAVQIREIDGMAMVYVPSGQFEMGTDETATFPNANPAHTVSLDAFWIDQTEVTNSMFSNFLNAEGNQSQEGIPWLEPGAGHRGITYGFIEENEGQFFTQEGYEDYPIIEVSWYGASAYCSWIGGRLPTEAEWEYAARGPDSYQYPWGNVFNGEIVNYCDNRCQESWKDTVFDDGAARWTNVGNYPEGASWCGALDLTGNVWEWVKDWWSEDYYSISPADNPLGPATGTYRIVRGGSWFDESWKMNTAFRKGLQLSSARMHWVGFRCVMSTDQ